MWRHCAILTTATLLGSCGLGETAATAAAAGASGAEATRQATEFEARIRAQLEEAQRQAAERRNAIDAAAGE